MTTKRKTTQNPDPATQSKFRFEQALERLEKIVSEMENGELELETMIERFEEGRRHLKFCADKLDEVERRIEMLVKKGDTVKLEPFDADGNDQDDTPSMSKPSASDGNGELPF